MATAICFVFDYILRNENSVIVNINCANVIEAKKMAKTKSVFQHKDNSDVQLYCICRSPVIDVFMIKCDFCEEWYHGDCIGITEEESESIDKFCCKRCKRKKPVLRTTYKKMNRKKNTRKENESEKISTDCQKTSNLSSNQNLEMLDIVKTPTVILSNAQPKKCPDFVDTTIRKAKTEAYRKFKESSNPAQSGATNNIGKKEKNNLKQCYGPGCTRASRKGSKYCSDECGITLAKHRILEILPHRIQQWNRTPSAADELSYKKLTNVRAKMHDIEKQLEEVEIKITKLIKNISQSKNPANNFVELPSDETTVPMDCMLCGIEIPSKFIERHLEQCYIKNERKVATDDKMKPSDEKWNIFCNRKIAKNLWCKKMKVLCSLHYENSRKVDEVCGFYLGKENGIDRYCGNKSRTCNHLNWEELHRATLDLEKLNLLLKFQDLKEEEENIRKEMSRRGDVLSLMCNFTIEH